MVEEMNTFEEQSESFAIQTTLSGLNYVARIKRWRSLGYRVSLYFLSLPDVEMAVSRFAERVQQGGHHVEASVTQRRFHVGLRNFDQHYRPVVDFWMMFDNSGLIPILIEEGINP